ncbi:uncharacterized protein LOC114515865 [Dendronephthya gigantea]|uniref:uncharacterized protein LOC114515865 n=1 Tax=Dendronephthya gigantea TaxID=151771 RepID=UPI00106D5209|nr:uncharacterized protein LOC114515865 [Dendronephthya gigantea]
MDTNPEDLKKQLDKYEKELAEVSQKWKRERRKLISLLREIANVIHKHEKNSRIAKITGASTSIVGTGLAIGGGIAAIFTFGASLVLTGVGIAVAVAGGTTVAGAEIANHLLRSTNVKMVNKVLEVDREETQNLQDLLKKIDEFAEKFKFSGKDFAKPCVKMGFQTGRVIGATVQLTKSIVSEAGETLFKTLGTASRVLHVAGLVTSFITLPIDIHTIVATALEVHKGSIPDAVKHIQNLVQQLEDEMDNVPDIPDKK